VARWNTSCATACKAASGALLAALIFQSEADAQSRGGGTADRTPPASGTLLFQRGVRGVTIGPIESSLQPGRGYGSPAYQHTLALIERMGGNWISLTPFGRIWDLSPTGVDRSFEQPARQTELAIRRSVEQAHAHGLKVLLVPHLWAETGVWRGHIDPPTERGWQRWADGYQQFLLSWARVAAQSGVDLLAVGVELRTFVTARHAPAFQSIIKKVRGVYSGPLTYAANWDDAQDTVIWGDLDVIGLNAFFPLAHKENDSPADLLRESTRIAAEIARLAQAWHKPVLFTEIGYTTRPSPALRPWEWPDGMKNVTVDQKAQAEAYRALIAPFLDQPWFKGFFVWRWYADADDMSQEAEWGFSPFGKQAELVVRDAFAAHWAADGDAPLGFSLSRNAARRIGAY
jgi:hypothetical protein